MIYRSSTLHLLEKLDQIDKHIQSKFKLKHSKNMQIISTPRIIMSIGQKMNNSILNNLATLNDRRNIIDLIDELSE